jgi:Predicted membrane-associated Zn-dependent proteases 1
MTILYFILVLGVTVFIHELGHFIFAKRAGIYCYEFSLGMGPKIFSKKRKNDETVYSIRLFPIGGFVQMAGEEVEIDEKIPKNKRMQSKTWMERFLTVIAGVMFNFILAIILLFIVALISGAPSNKSYIGKLYKEYPIYQSGLKVGDQITHLNGKKVSSSDILLLNLQVNNNKTITFTVKDKKGISKDIKITGVKEKVKGETIYRYGFALEQKIEKGILPSIKYAFTKTKDLLNQMVHIIIYLVTGTLGISSLAGPVGIYNIVGESAKAGFVNVLFLIAYLCINVGFINLLPIPAFDGGRILFMIIEKIRGKSLNPKTENMIHSVFLFLLFGLMIVITIFDVMRLFK